MVRTAAMVSPAVAMRVSTSSLQGSDGIGPSPRTTAPTGVGTTAITSTNEGQGWLRHRVGGARSAPRRERVRRAVPVADPYAIRTPPVRVGRVRRTGIRDDPAVAGRIAPTLPGKHPVPWTSHSRFLD